MRVRYTNFVDVDAIVADDVQFQEFEYLTDQTIPDEWFSYAWDVFKDGIDWSRSGCDFNKDEDKERWNRNYLNYLNNFPKTRTLPKKFFKQWGPVISNLQLGRRYKSIDNPKTYLHTNYAKRQKTRKQPRDNMPKGNLEELALMHSYNIKPTVDIVHWKNTYSDKNIINQLDLKVRERFNIDDSLPTTCYFTPTLPAYWETGYPTHSNKYEEEDKSIRKKRKHDEQVKAWGKCYVKELEYTEVDNNTRMSFDGCDWQSYEIELVKPVHNEVYELIRDYTLFNDSDYHALMREIVTLTETYV